MGSQFNRRVVRLINQERIDAGLDPLKVDSQLRQAAIEHSQSMADDDFFSHTGADGSSPFERIKDTGYKYRTAGENIAAGFTTPKTVVEAWMGSSGHRRNILNPNFTEIGVGHDFEANDQGQVNYGHYWTVNFGSPLE
ncbi:MAG TPA: CAP domain-containing protein [Xenococcaceae cyanobacterium]